MRTTRTLIVMLLCCFALSVAASPADPHVGTWKLNIAKSKYSPGPAPKEVTMKIEAKGAGIHLTQAGADAAGKAIKVEFTANFDGKDTPVTGITNTDTIAVKRVDANTWDVTLKKAGKVVMTITSVVSKDGKTRTSTFKGTDAAGKPVNNVAAYDKQ
ncbi:MAG: hypothetical protein ACHP7I_07880 [Terriglobales bacterium]